jgi:hypothetical protein
MPLHLFTLPTFELLHCHINLAVTVFPILSSTADCNQLLTLDDKHQPCIPT